MDEAEVWFVIKIMMGPEQSVSGVEVESVVLPKYYMQLADHQLLDLFREAVKAIVVFGKTLPDLPLAEVQREIFIIYDNSIVRSSDL